MQTARLPRTLGAIFYDAIILFALIFIAAQWFPLIPDSANNGLFVKLGKQLYILGIGYLYFAYSWRRGGQTIGMKAWRIKIVPFNSINLQDDAQIITWWQCLQRYIVAIFSWLVVGVGFIWALFKPHYRSWHDMASKTKLVILPKT